MAPCSSCVIYEKMFAAGSSIEGGWKSRQFLTKDTKIGDKKATSKWNLITFRQEQSLFAFPALIYDEDDTETFGGGNEKNFRMIYGKK